MAWLSDSFVLLNQSEVMVYLQGKITRGVHLALYSGTILELAVLFLERALIGHRLDEHLVRAYRQ